MKYFAKYLPIEGELTKNCVAIDNKNIVQHIGDNPVLPELKKAGWKLAKLFLCSRNIQAGDEYYTNSFQKYKTPLEPDEDFFKYNNERFKVIGEISPEATWVNEGDEFEEGDYRIRWYSLRAQRFTPHGDYEPSDEYTNLGEGRKYGHTTTYVQIKGPCGHFH